MGGFGVQPPKPPLSGAGGEPWASALTGKNLGEVRPGDPALGSTPAETYVGLGLAAHVMQRNSTSELACSGNARNHHKSRIAAISSPLTLVEDSLNTDRAIQQFRHYSSTRASNRILMDLSRWNGVMWQSVSASPFRGQQAVRDMLVNIQSTVSSSPQILQSGNTAVLESGCNPHLLFAETAQLPF